MKAFAVVLLLVSSVSYAAETTGTVTADVGQVQTEEKGASAWGTFSGNLAGTSDYIFRGQSLSNHNPAAQGEVDWTHSSGAYVGAWGSNVSIPGTSTPFEADLYGGYNYAFTAFNQSWTLGAGVMYYSYYRGSDMNTLEYPLTIGWNDLKLGFAYSPHWGASDAGHEMYLSASWSRKVKWETTLVLAAGYSIFAPDLDIPNYADFHIGLQHDFFGLTWDASGYFVSSEPTTDGLYGPRAVLTVSKSL
jgi:uncharacterized protein (TIGR02001 family)